MAWVRRINSVGMLEKGGLPTDGLPWVCDWRSFDIPPTVVGGIRNAAPGMVAMSLSMLGGREMIEAAEAAARERGIRILWWFGPGGSELTEDGRSRLRSFVRAARARMRPDLPGHSANSPLPYPGDSQ